MSLLSCVGSCLIDSTRLKLKQKTVFKDSQHHHQRDSRTFIKAAKALGIKDSLHGSIGFTHRWGSALNLYPHLHILCLDGVFTMVKDVPKIQNVEPLSDDATENLPINITTKILKHLRRCVSAN
ncbi:MAG: transposase [Proteobacteria bacterium]|nr:transposase [Pseudomonadota bacterium]